MHSYPGCLLLEDTGLCLIVTDLFFLSESLIMQAADLSEDGMLGGGQVHNIMEQSLRSHLLGSGSPAT